jgi:hypothetical protein
MLVRAETVAEKSAQAAKDSADVARDTLIATQRPWVWPDVRLASDLVFDDKGATVTFGYTLRNSGNTPALRVEVYPRFFMFDWGEIKNTEPVPTVVRPQTRPDEELLKLCRGAVIFSEQKAKVEFLLGDPLFPNKEIESGVTLNIPKDAVDTATAASGPKLVLPILLFCVTYRYPADTKSHYTGFAFIITRKPINASGEAGDIKPAEGTIPSMALRLLPHPFSSGMAN